MTRDDLIYILLQKGVLFSGDITISNDELDDLIKSRIIVKNDNDSFSLNELDNTYLAKLANRFVKRNEEDKALIVYKKILLKDEFNYKALEKLMSYYIKRHMWNKAFEYFMLMFKCNNINRKFVNLYLLLFSKVMPLPDFYSEYLNSLEISDITIDKNKYAETDILNDYMELITSLFEGIKINNIFQMFKNIIRRKGRKTKRDNDIESFLSYMVYYEPDFNDYVKGSIDRKESKEVLEVIIKNINNKEIYDDDDNYFKVVFYLLASLDKLKGIPVKKEIPVTKEEFDKVVINPKYKDKEPLKTLVQDLDNVISIGSISKEKIDYHKYIDKIEYLINIHAFVELKKIIKGLTDDNNKESMKNLKALIDLYDYCNKNELAIRFDLLGICKKIILYNESFDKEDLNDIKKLYVNDKKEVNEEISEIIDGVNEKEKPIYVVKNIVGLSIDDEPLLEKESDNEKDINEETSDDLYKSIGNSYNTSGNSIMALYYYQLYLKKNPKDLEVTYKLYGIYKDINYYDGAIKLLNGPLYNTTLIKDHDNEQKELLEMSKKDKPDYIYLIEKNDNNYYKGLKFFYLKNYNKALFYFTLCLTTNIFINRYVYNYMARCYSKLGNEQLYNEYLDKANRLYTKRIKNVKSPNYNNEYNILVKRFKLYYAQRNYSACIFLYNRIKNYSKIFDIKLAFMVNKCYEEMNLENMALSNLYTIKNVLEKENYPLKTVIKNIERLENKNKILRKPKILKKVV